jgi:hypothetical protein
MSGQVHSNKWTMTPASGVGAGVSDCAVSFSDSAEAPQEQLLSRTIATSPKHRQLLAPTPMLLPQMPYKSIILSPEQMRSLIDSQIRILEKIINCVCTQRNHDPMTGHLAMHRPSPSTILVKKTHDTPIRLKN